MAEDTESMDSMDEPSGSAWRARLQSEKEHLLTGVSYMIPFVTIGGIFLALAFAVGDTQQVFEQTGTLGWFMAQIGSAGLTLMVPALGAYIAYAIADRPGIAPGFILTWIIQQDAVMAEAGAVVGFTPETTVQAGYLGALVIGLLAGYTAKWVKNWSIPSYLKPMMPVLIIPIVTTAILAPIALVFVGVPVAWANAALNAYLQSIGTAQAIVLGSVIGLFMAFDMGGPVNKVAYFFGVGLIAEGITEPMAAVMIAGMTPPLGMAISNFIAPQKYAEDMYQHGKSAVVLSLSFITEGAIPYAAADPLRVIPSLMVGSAVAVATSMAMGITMPAPHGGIFVVPLSNNPLAFLGAYALGALVTAAMVTVLKPDQRESAGDEGIWQWL